MPTQMNPNQPDKEEEWTGMFPNEINWEGMKLIQPKNSLSHLQDIDRRFDPCPAHHENNHIEGKKGRKVPKLSQYVILFPKKSL